MKKFTLIVLAAVFAVCLCARAEAEKTRYLTSPGAAQYPPFTEHLRSQYQISSSVSMVDNLPPTVPYPAQWPYSTSQPYTAGWAYPTWSPYSFKWYYKDQYPYYEWWSYSDWLAFKDKWSYGDSLKYTSHWEDPANWPAAARWSPTDRWPNTSDRPSTADTGTIDMLNKRGEAIAFGDYTFLLEPGDSVYITRQNRLLGVARAIQVSSSYTMLQAVRVSRDYFLQVGDTFQMYELARDRGEASAPRVDSITDDGRILSDYDFMSRDYKRNDFFTLRRNGQNAGTARVMQVGYGYAILQPSEDTTPMPGDALIFNTTPGAIKTISHPTLIQGAEKQGIFVDKTNEEMQMAVEENNQREHDRALIKKAKKTKEEPENDMWWEDTTNDQEPWPDEK
jgi:hypothetical protein